ncbi:MAG: APC family permease [Proteobacteria bacterium]|nr:APC family permease [Pseudomonadota bacterium]
MSTGPGPAPLTRAVGFWGLAAAIVNITIGGSIFALPATLYLTLGPAAPLAYILGAALFAPIVLCFAAAGSRFTTTGGPYRYVESAFGKVPGLLVAALFWISNVAGSGSMAAILVNQATHILPVLEQPLPRAAFLAVVYSVLFTLNARGVKLGARAIVAFAAAKMIPLLLLAAGGLMLVHPANLQIVTAPDARSLGRALVVAVFAYSGIETALAPSGELRDPARVVPGAALVGVAIVVVLYVSLQVAAQGVLGPALAGHDAPLSAVAERLLPGSAGLVIVTASVSLIGVLLGDLLGSSRLLYALAQDGLLPSALASVSARYRVPTRAIFTHAAVGWVLAASGTFNTLAMVSGAAFCVVYIACCAAAWRLQSTGATETSAPFRLPGGGLIPAVGIACLLLVLLSLA